MNVIATRPTSTGRLLTALLVGLLLSAGSIAARAQSIVPRDEPIGILLVVGDISRCGDKLHLTQDDRVAELVSDAVEAAKRRNLPVRLILLGDLAYEKGTTAQFRDCFNPSWGKFKSIMLPVPGNHEYERKNGSNNARPYFNYFRSEPKNHKGQPLVTSQGPRTGYYSYRFPDPVNGPWLFFGINTYTKSKNKPHWRTWLDNELKANEQRGNNKTPCIVAFSHAFRYSSGYHGHNENKKNSNAKVRKGSYITPTYKILLRHRASIMLTAHDHHFEQFSRMNADGNKDPKGVRQFVVGTGGGNLYLEVIKKHYQTVYKKQAPNQEHLTGDQYGVMRIELYPDRYSWLFLPTEGLPIVPVINSDRCNF